MKKLRIRELSVLKELFEFMISSIIVKYIIF